MGRHSREEIPEELRAQAADYLEQILETAAEYNDELMEKYFKGQEITPEECYRALRKATIHHALVPVLCGSSYRNKGVQPLLEAVVALLPSPIDVGAVKGFDFKSGQEDFRLPDMDAPFSALVFKIMVDPFVGKLAFVRLLGTAEEGVGALQRYPREKAADQPLAEDACELPRRS